MDARYSKEAFSMKKQTLIKTLLAITAGILMILISFTGFQTILPTGKAFMPLAGVIAVGIAVALGINIAFIVTLVSAIIMIVLGTADWVILVDFIVILIVVGLILRKQVPLSIDLNHSQLLWLAIFTQSAVPKTIMIMALTSVTINAILIPNATAIPTAITPAKGINASPVGKIV